MEGDDLRMLHSEAGSGIAARGDLEEEYQTGRSSGWYWRQVIGGNCRAACGKTSEIILWVANC